MVRILVNEEALDFAPESETTIGELLGEVERFCNENGHTVFKIMADGHEVLSSELDSLFSKPTGTDITLRLFTKSGQEVSESIAQIGKTFLEEAMALKEVGVKLQTNDDAFAVDLIGEVSMNIKALLEYVNLMEILGGDEKLKARREAIIRNQESINAFLSDITTALEEKDIITVSDLSEYELAPLLETLGNVLTAG